MYHVFRVPTFEDKTFLLRSSAVFSPLQLCNEGRRASLPAVLAAVVCPSRIKLVFIFSLILFSAQNTTQFDT